MTNTLNNFLWKGASKRTRGLKYAWIEVKNRKVNIRTREDRVKMALVKPVIRVAEIHSLLVSISCKM